MRPILYLHLFAKAVKIQRLQFIWGLSIQMLCELLILPLVCSSESRLISLMRLDPGRVRAADVNSPRLLGAPSRAGECEQRAASSLRSKTSGGWGLAAVEMEKLLWRVGVGDVFYLLLSTVPTATVRTGGFPRRWHFVFQMLWFFVGFLCADPFYAV